MSRPARFSVFDLDQTLLKENSSLCFGKYLYRKKHIPLSSFLFIIWSSLRYHLGFLAITDLHQQAFQRLFYGKLRPIVEAWVAEFLDTHLDSLIYTPAFAALTAAKRAGDAVAIMSSSPSFIVEPIAKRFDVSLYRATQYGVDKDDCFCHIAALVLGEDKARFVTEFMQLHQIQRKNVAAYTDSFLDLPFLLSAGIPVAVNPDKKLSLFCAENQWPTI